MPEAAVPAQEHGCCEVLLTGHNNGSVTFWDLSYETPRRLCHHSCDGNGKAVSVLSIDTVAGLLAVGNRGGEVCSALSV
jgi:hypothetical protein